MRMLSLLATLVLFSGCSASDLTYGTPPSAPPATAAAANYANFTSGAGSVETKCKAVAGTRSRDAAYQAIDDEARDAVYQKTYADCLAWTNRGQK
jgi:hypothetical protein